MLRLVFSSLNQAVFAGAIFGNASKKHASAVRVLVCVSLGVPLTLIHVNLDLSLSTSVCLSFCLFSLLSLPSAPRSCPGRSSLPALRSVWSLRQARQVAIFDCQRAHQTRKHNRNVCVHATCTEKNNKATTTIL